MYVLKSEKKAFTLIEIVVVMAIIAVLAALMTTAIVGARRTAINTKKVSDMKTIMIGLEIYHTRYGTYPTTNYNNACGGWEVGNSDSTTFLSALNNVGIAQVPVDQTASSGSCSGYRYFLYSAGDYGCTGGAFYVLGAHLDGGRSGSSPGFSCSDRSWTNDEFDWVTGSN